MPEAPVWDDSATSGVYRWAPPGQQRKPPGDHQPTKPAPSSLPPPAPGAHINLPSVCTIIIINQLHPTYPLIVAGNRDEFYARATRPPELIARRPATIAGVDAVEGGTWMGANATGLAVAVTNQRSYGAGINPGLASRGQVVRRALSETTTRAIDDLLGELDGRDYNSFNLLYGNADRVAVAYSRRDRAAIDIVEVNVGVSVLPNDCLDSPAFAKAARARARARAIVSQPWPELTASLRDILADHWLPDLDAVPRPPPGAMFNRETARMLEAMCVHTAPYGTRSATILAVTENQLAHYLYGDGPPCQTELREVTSLIDSASQ